MKIALIGKDGQVGFALREELKDTFDIHAFGRNDISDRSDLDQLDHLGLKLKKINPDIIINCAAYTDVDQAELNHDKAFKLNSFLPSALSEISNDLNSLLIHFSSDYVYPGTGKEAWSENSPTEPASKYASSKLDGDMSVVNNAKKFFIFRTSWVYSLNGKNFPNTMLKIGKDLNELSIINDQIGSPTNSKLIALIVKMAIIKYKNSSESSKFNGIYNLAPRGYISWYDFAVYIFANAKIYNKSYNKIILKPISSKDYNALAMRPLNSRLDCSKLSHFLDLEMPSWEEGMKIFFNDKFI